MKIFLLLMVMLFSNESVSQDTVYLKKNLSLFSGTLGGIIDRSVIYEQLLDIKFKFEGYLVVEIEQKDLFQDDTVKYSCSVFWVDSLRELSNEKEKYYYFTLFPISIIARTYKIKKGKHAEEIKNFLRFYRAFNEANRDYFSTYLYDSSLKTNILDGENLWSYEGKYYIIFESSFTTSILKIKMPTSEGETFDYANWKIFVPISRLGLMTIVPSKLLRSLGMEETNINIKLK